MLPRIQKARSNMSALALNMQRHLYAMDAIYFNRPAPTIFPRGDKEGLYIFAEQTIGNHVPITYLEFGVYKGRSIRSIAQKFSDPKAKFIGFDSFEGFPEDWIEMKAPAGHYSTGGEEPLMNDARISFVKGWFQNTVPKFFAEHDVTGTTLVHFDADLYSSTLFLLATIWHNVSDYYFIFDDFNGQEVDALHDFARSFPVEFQFIATIMHENGTPLQTFGRMKNVEYQPRAEPKS